MLRSIFLVCNLALALILSFPARAAEDSSESGASTVRPADHVVLVSIDGLRPEFYLDATWGAPMLRQLAEQGGYAERVRSVYPTVTYPSHTSIITGVLPSRHGIYYNSPFEPEGQTGRWYWEDDLITAPTLWDVTRAAGLTSASVSWPVTVGAPVDFLIPEIWALGDADFVETTRALCHPPDLLAELEREATGRLTEENFTIDHMTRDDRAGDIAAYLLATYKPNLMAVHLIQTDHYQHQDGRDSWLVRRSVGAADRALSQIYEAAERVGILDRTVFLITGDHGHVDLHTRIAPNTLLVEAGLMEPSTRERGSWRATFHTTGAAAFLHLKDPADQEAVRQVRELLADLPAGVKDLFRIIERDELDALGAAPEAVLALAPAPGVNVSSRPEGPLVSAATGATHGYLPDVSPEIYTGLVVSGSGIRKGSVAHELRLTDVAPWVAHLLGLEMSTEDGVVPWGFVETP